MSKIQKKYIFNQCLYTMIQISVDLHKLLLWFSRRRLRLFLKFFRQSVHKMMSFLSHLQHSRPCCIGHTNSRLWLEFVSADTTRPLML